MAQRIGFLLFVLLACVFDWFLTTHHQSKLRQQIAMNRSSLPESSVQLAHNRLDFSYSPSVDPRSNRVVYPYSVIPGGIRNVLELKDAIASDPIISAHYAGFRIDRARITISDRERAFHVSYRIGNQVYWTRRLVRIAKGELLITDGVHTSRTRCGNQIAEFLPATVSDVFEREPSVLELDTPLDISIHTSIHKVDPETPMPVILPLKPTTPPTHNTPPNDPGLPVPPNPTPYVPLPGPPAVVKVPEPGTGILLITALPIIAIFRKRYRREVSK